MFKVADVSSAQGANIAGIIAENDAVIVKVTEGNYYINPNWKEQVRQSLAAGKRVGLYHYMHGGVDPVEQAKYFINEVGVFAQNDTIPLILDFENSNRLDSNGNRIYPELTGQEVKPFNDYIENQTGKKVWMYLGAGDVNGGYYDWTNLGITDNPLWLAGYPLFDGQKDNYDDEVAAKGDRLYFNQLKHWSTVTMWQWSSTPYDKSVLYGDVNTWDALSKRSAEHAQDAVDVQPNVQPVSPDYDENSAIDKFKDGGNVFYLQGAMTIQDVKQLDDGTWVVRVDELETDFDWNYNGIPTVLLDNLTTRVRDFNPGDQVVFKELYNHGTIDKYDKRYNVIGIYYMQGKYLVWYDADKAYDHY
ncbi:lysozyme [Fructobacillus fructosus]|uniref:glycoside hydrolase family 25 protein n=1 Tax=Fructobacillus fructosus TaxID=1631 RepID=UPI0002194E83|nr:bacteriophage lysin [Fructobacillus fructosus]KRN52125.1 bacteriophage lysin [Fructobacillus fructosus KCTC 3544]GAP01918.1 lysozyme [Fructobacillus fructosus]